MESHGSTVEASSRCIGGSTLRGMTLPRKCADKVQVGDGFDPTSELAHHET